MPNWCENFVEIEGDKTTIAESALCYVQDEFSSEDDEAIRFYLDRGYG